MTQWTDRLDQLVESESLGHRLGELLRLPTVDSWEPGLIETSWTVHPDYISITGTLFGGYISALADQVASHVAFTLLEDGEFPRTISLGTDYYHSIADGTIGIKGRLIHSSRSLIFAEVEFRKDDKLCARSEAVLARVPIAT
jgi:uncharacterized protein (TIGR00369 family)